MGGSEPDDNDTYLVARSIALCVRAFIVLVLTLGGCTMVNQATDKWLDRERFFQCYAAGGLWQYTVPSDPRYAAYNCVWVPGHKREMQ